ncbi:hypothetical protein E9993_14780 [Labilibacter sediminis]|nr:hypothetical protein E9993_14780 [Labilibacter sediminis]
MSNLQSPDIPHKAMLSRFEAIKEVHKARGSFIYETAHFIAPSEELPFYYTELTEPHLHFRPLDRNERRHIQEKKALYATIHAEKLANTLEKFNELEVLEQVAKELSKGRVLR